MHRALGEDPRTESLREGGHGYLIHHLSLICQEYVLLQISKLHDPAVQKGRVNLSVDYVIDYGGWDAATKSELGRLRTRLELLEKRLRKPRNRLLSHNDLVTILDNKALGTFPPGLDDDYFATLQELVDIVHDRVAGGPHPFSQHARTDVLVLLKAIAGGRAPVAQ